MTGPLAPLRSRLHTWWWLAALTTTACTENSIQIETDMGETDVEPTGGTTMGTTAGTTPTIEPADSSGDSSTAPTAREVDILLVVDNSGSMGEEQGALAQSIGTLVALLDSSSPPVDYRIGVTTTDNGNPWCQGTGPEAGMLRATSCLARPTEFVFEGPVTIDAFQEACANVCVLEDLGLTEPWIEVLGSAGTSNVPGDAVVDALRCMLPQGINGCGFESHLESMWKAVRRSSTDGEASFGFLRDGALHTIIFMTDEADCSYDDQWETIFLPDGNRVFWSDPSAPAPTSAVCWNAGVACTGSGTYEECHSVNVDVNGEQVADADADELAVLRPLDRYSDILLELGGFYVVAIGGVNSDGTVTYQDALTDPDFQTDFGIGPGCESSMGRAVPPVRIRELIDRVNGAGSQSMFSVCDADYTGAFGAVANGILQRLP